MGDTGNWQHGVIHVHSFHNWFADMQICIWVEKTQHVNMRKGDRRKKSRKESRRGQVKRIERRGRERRKEMDRGKGKVIIDSEVIETDGICFCRMEHTSNS